MHLSQISLALTRLSGQFSPASLFAAGEVGAWYDPSDLTTLFTDSAGTTPVTAVEQFVGLMLDKSKGLNPATKGGVAPGAAGSGFTSPDSVASSITGDIDIRVQVALVDWTPSAASALVSKDTTLAGQRSYDFNVETSGALSFIKSTDGTTLHIATSSVATGFADGSTNWVRATYATSTGNVNFFYSSDGANWTQLGTTQTITSGAIADTTAQLAVGIYANENALPASGKFYRAQIYSGINGTLAVDFNPTRYASGSTFTAATGEVWTIKGTARIVPDGNHATSTGTKRPKLAARYNLLTYTEQFDNGAWTKASVTINANAAVAPDGTTTADLVYPNTNGSFRGVYQAASGLSASYITSFYAKSFGKNWFAIIGVSGNASTVTYFNLANGTVGTVGSGQTPSMVFVGNGWYRCSLTSTAISQYSHMIVVDADANTAVTANGTDGVLIWGADLRPASQATGLIGPTYQRVVDAATYDTAGFLPYLQFDGIDDSMSTGSIDFTATDKMTVWAGVRRLGTGTALLLELSADLNANAGTFSMSQDAGTSTWTFSSKGTVRADATSGSSYPSPITTVNAGIGDIAGDVTTLRVNGTQVATSAGNQGAGNYGNYPLYLAARAGTTLYFNGWLTSLIVRGAQSTQSQIEATEAWVNQRTGAF